MAEKATLYLENNKGMILDFTRSPQACDVYDFDGNLISGGGGGGGPVFKITFTNINTTPGVFHVPTGEVSLDDVLYKTEYGYFDYGPDLGSFSEGETKELTVVPVVLFTSPDDPTYPQFGLIYTADEPSNVSIENLVNCTEMTIDNGGTIEKHYVITDPDVSASFTLKFTSSH